MEVIVINGSNRHNSNTARAIKSKCPFPEYEIIHLVDYDIKHYDYCNEKEDDDFLRLVDKVLSSNIVIFATPVYWYSMSGRMKVFFDRLTDLITSQKEFGRRLKGKKIYLITQGSDEVLPTGFDVPFRNTANYFEMDFCETFYIKY